MRPMGPQRGSGALRHVTRIAGWLLIVSGLTTFAGAASMQQTSTPARAHDATDAFDALYERGRPIEATLRTIRARFTETTTSSLLVQPLVAEGTLVVRRPHEVVLRYTQPDVKTLRLDEASLLLVWPGRSIRERRDIREAQNRVQRYFVGKSPDELRQHFTITTSEDAARARDLEDRDGAQARADQAGRWRRSICGSGGTRSCCRRCA